MGAQQQRLPANATALRVVVFFARHPDEELMTDDISVKFGLSRALVHVTLRRMVQAALLHRTKVEVKAKVKTQRKPDFEWSYSAGPALLEAIRIAPTPEPCVASDPFYGVVVR